MELNAFCFRAYDLEFRERWATLNVANKLPLTKEQLLELEDILNDR